ncbi:MAG: DinB family protein [Chloroflexi bacterium]|nr:DinB family protein [Chloroflexota bacterium]
MSSRINELKQELSAARHYLNAVLDRVGDRWDEPVYSEEAGWTARQLLIHLMVSDRGHNNMLMAIARGENTIPEDFDLERFNRRSVEKRAETTVDEARAALAQSAAERAAWLDTIDDSTLDKQGRHGSMRILSIAEILRVVAGHDRLHADDIARALGLS